MSEKNLTTTNQDLLDKQRGEEAFLLEGEIKDLKKKVGNNFLEMGRVLKEIKDKDYYRELGYETIIDWLSSPDISISQGWAWNFIAVYEIFIEQYQLSPERVALIDYTKLQQIVPIVKKDPEHLEDWLTKAEELRRVDLCREIREFRQQSNPEDILEDMKAQTTPIGIGELRSWFKLISAIKNDLPQLENLKNEDKRTHMLALDQKIADLYSKIANVVKRATGIENPEDILKGKEEIK